MDAFLVAQNIFVPCLIFEVTNFFRDLEFFLLCFIRLRFKEQNRAYTGNAFKLGILTNYI